MAPPWTTIAPALLALTSTPALAREPALALVASLAPEADREPATPARPRQPALVASLAPDPTAVDPTTPTARIRVAILRSDGAVERAELERAIRLRLPGVTLVSDGEAAPAAEPGSLRAFIDLRQTESELLLTLILADGRAFLRPLERGADDPARPVASALANLVAAIEDDTAVADKQDVPVPAALLAPPPEPVPKASTPPPPVTRTPPREPEPEPAPRWQLGPLLRATAGLGLAPPGLRGAGAGLGLDARAPGGLLLAADLQWLTQAQGPLRLSRLRVALGLGYALRRGGFELPAAAMLGVEPWRLGDGHGHRLPISSPAGDPGPLIGLGLRLSPGYSAAIGRSGARLRVGARVELWGSGLAGPGLRRPVIHLPTGNTTLGGLELNLGLEIGVWLPVGPGQKRRSKRTGP